MHAKVPNIEMEITLYSRKPMTILSRWTTFSDHDKLFSCNSIIAVYNEKKLQWPHRPVRSLSYFTLGSQWIVCVPASFMHLLQGIAVILKVVIIRPTINTLCLEIPPQTLFFTSLFKYWLLFQYVCFWMVLLEIAPLQPE